MNTHPLILTAMAASLHAFPAAAQGNLLSLPERWTVTGDASGFVTDHNEPVLRLRGSASLDDFVFQDGTISFDVRLTHRAGFVGVRFRSAGTDAEHVYLRPHRSGEWDALQYQPIMNGSPTWQLYRGEGYTAPVALPHGEWISIRIEVRGANADLFVDGQPEPTMRIRLERGLTRGGIGFTAGFRDETPMSELPGSFRRLVVNEATPSDQNSIPASVPTGDDPFVRSWEISEPFPLASLPATYLPDTVGVWNTVRAEPRGIVNLNRYFTRLQGTANTAVIARKTIDADHDTIIPFVLDFSDHASVFLNGELLFNGTNSWQSRYPYYLGVLHPDTMLNTLWLRLTRGENELSLVVTETAFGWGFVAKTGTVRGVRWR